MSWSDPRKEDGIVYKVLVNDEGQYSIWPDFKELPAGWKTVGKTGSKFECLAYVKEVWTDMTPLSLRKKMEEFSQIAATQSSRPAPNALGGKNLVDRLCEGHHPVEVALRPEKTSKLFKEALDRNYIYIRFTQTRGGTELGFQLDREASDFSAADFDSSRGIVHIEGALTHDYVKVRCVADIDLNTLEGVGCLVKVQVN